LAAAERRPNGARLPWVPILWPMFLAGCCWWIARTAVDPGVTNTVIHVAVALGVAGVAAWIVFSSGLRGWRRWALALTPMALVAAFYMQLLPIKTLNNGAVGLVGWRWRWADPDRSLEKPKASSGVRLDWRETPQDYPAFLGGRAWAEVEGVALDPDWKQRPPRLLWKQPIGAGWSGFAVVGDYAVTQEQRGEEELIVCYEARTGKVAWTHSDSVRWDPRGSGALGGIGPRATPTIHQGRVITQGATGLLNCLDAATGKLLWSHDTLAEHDADQLMWGKAGSPLIVDDRVVVSVGAPGASLVAYDVATGSVAWKAGSQRSSYATPVLTELLGVRQILVTNEGFVTGHRADDGQVLWEVSRPSLSDSSAASSNPTPIADDCVLLTKGYGLGGEVIKLSRQGKSFSAETAWKNPAVLKTKMSNVVVREGFAYGLDEEMLQCVDLQTGRPRWKKRRRPEFGYGQVTLVGDALVVLSEGGEVILAEATPKKYVELASMPAIEGITWNTPAIAGNLLLVRNAEEAAAFELPVREREAH
jgi:outer membrane protein assembly factor BamB